MKLKYYLRGAGIGIIVATLVLTIAFANKKVKLSDDEIKLQAQLLGMVTAEKADEMESKLNSLENDNKTLKKQLEELNDTKASDEGEVKEEKTKDDNTKPTADGEQKTEQKTENDSDKTKKDNDTKPAQNNSASVTFKIEAGMGSETVSKILAANGLVADSAEFNKYMVNAGYSDLIQVGEYTIQKGATYDDIVKVLLGN